ncbi:MAG: SPOR domain-containing protein [Gammaproteobacteria bacterium]|nr:SPOR domain-containing protein [Gammaproteobacteria bacterium]
MNETLSKRLIGLALVLVVLFLLSFLLPRRHAPPEDHAIPLSAAPVGSRSSAAVAESAAAANSAAAATTPASAASATTSIAAVPKPVVHGARAAAARKPAAPAAAWWVQVASFSNAHSADKVLASVKPAEMHGEVASAVVGRHTYYRVRLGPFKSGAAAEQARQHAAAQGFPHARVLAPN